MEAVGEEDAIGSVLVSFMVAFGSACVAGAPPARAVVGRAAGVTGRGPGA
jgi:hypothetical protein